MKLIIEIPNFETGLEMEENLNRAIDELNSVLAKKGLSEVELVGQDFDNNSKTIYNIRINKETDGWILTSDQLPALTEPIMWYNDKMKRHEVMFPNYKATVWAYSPELGQFKAEYTKRMGWSEISSVSVKGIPAPPYWKYLPKNPDL